MLTNRPLLEWDLVSASGQRVGAGLSQGSLSPFPPLVAVLWRGSHRYCVSAFPAILGFLEFDLLSLVVKKVFTSVSILLQGEMLCVQVQIQCAGRKRWIQALSTSPAQNPPWLNFLDFRHVFIFKCCLWKTHLRFRIQKHWKKNEVKKYQTLTRRNWCHCLS